MARRATRVRASSRAEGDHHGRQRDRLAIAFAREGADLLIAHLPSESEDAATCKTLIEEAGRKAVMAAGDVSDAAFREKIVERAVDELGGVDILVNNAAYQKPFGRG